MANSANHSRKDNVISHGKVSFWTAIVISFFPLVLKVTVSIIHGNDTPHKVLKSAIISLQNSPKLLIAILAFGLTILLLHGLLGYLSWRLWRPLSVNLKLPSNELFLLGILFFISLQIGILAWNSLLFPNSKMHVMIPWLFAGVGSLAFIAVLFWHTAQWLKSPTKTVWQPGLALTALCSLGLTGFLAQPSVERNAQAQRTQPDILIIGLDSFRPDHLKRPEDKISITPNLDAFLTEAYRFDHTYTPMARTYPAWMSILTGRYPIEHGARFNLLDAKYLKNREQSLPFLLKSKGYQTAYAIDETRFSNIDKSYGFDTTVTPEIGAADFVLAAAADLPLNNLLSMAPKLHAAVFPYQFMNRAIHNTYEPKTFDEELVHAIESADVQRPLFMVTHFELPHWPYDWRESSDFAAPENPRLAALSPFDYQKSVYRADQQFAALIDILKRNGRLNNAVVVVLSDHGEGFGESALNLQPGQDKVLMDIPPSKGHGINVLDEGQIRVLLAFKRYGGETLKPGIDARLTSLVDVAPTTLSLAGLDKDELKATGCDLFSKETKLGCDDERVVFTESGFYVPAMLAPGGFDEKKIAEQSQDYYNVNPDTARLAFKNSVLPQLLKDKQRAAIGQNIIVASLPQYGNEQFMAANLDSHLYWNTKKIGSKNIPPVQKKLFSKLCMQYKGDDVSLDEYCASL